MNLDMSNRFEKLEAKLQHQISLRVSKKEFQENKAFQLSLTREVKQIAKQNREMCDNLQIKYDNLDRFYLPV